MFWWRMCIAASAGASRSLQVDGKIVFGSICKHSTAVCLCVFVSSGKSDSFIKSEICKDRTQRMWSATSQLRETWGKGHKFNILDGQCW